MDMLLVQIEATIFILKLKCKSLRDNYKSFDFCLIDKILRITMD